MVAQDGARTIASRESLNDSRQLGSKDQVQSHNCYQNLLDGTLLMWSGSLQCLNLHQSFGVDLFLSLQSCDLGDLIQ